MHYLQDKRILITVFALLAILVLNIRYSAKQSLWHDEAYTLAFTQNNSIYSNAIQFQTIENSNNLTTKKILHYFSTTKLSVKELLILEGHPPLYFLLIKEYCDLVGPNKIFLRLFSTFFGQLTFIYLLFNIQQKGLQYYLILLLIISNPFLFYFNSEARMYSLAMFFATVSYFSFKKIHIGQINKFLYILSATCLFYTHYFGIIFITTLLLSKYRILTAKKLNLFTLIPYLLFLPWISIIFPQLEFHQSHWTDGKYSLIDSILSYLKSGIHFISGPNTFNKYDIITLWGSLILIYTISNINFSKIKLVSKYFIYCLLLVTFDYIFNKHTIAVTRYYIFIFIFIIDDINSLQKNNVISYGFIWIGTIIISMFSINKIYRLDTARKQMFEEAAYYIDTYHENDKIYYTEAGPMIFMLSHHLSKEHELIKYNNQNLEENCILVEENLGLKREINKFQKIPFAGINIYTK